MTMQRTARQAPDAHPVLPLADRRYRLEPTTIARIAEAGQAAIEAPKARLPGFFARAVAAIRVWRERAQSRRDLASCDRRMLRDIGVPPLDAGREIGKPFWRA